jgi:hypothetical protein
MLRPATIGGGEWSAKDLLGHVAFWEELAVQALEERRAGQRPAVAAIFEAGAGGTDRANAENQDRTSGQSLAEVRSRATVARRRVIEAIRGMDEAEWVGSPGYEDERRPTLGALLGNVLGGAPLAGPFGYGFAHLPDLEAYVRSVQGREG